MKNIKDFGAIGNGINDDTLAIQTLLDIMKPTLSTTPPGYPANFSAISIPNGRFRVTKPLLIPCGVSVYGEGGGSIIIRDYGESNNTTDNRAFRVLTKEGNANYFFNDGASNNQVFKDFCVWASNTGDITNSVGIDISADGPVSRAQAVNYSVVDGQFENISISGFDTAFNIIECWNSNFRGLIIDKCTLGINIAGKCCNLFFSEIQATRFVGTSTGIYIDSKFYADGEGRPEGITFDNCLFASASQSLNLIRCLFFRITESILDLGGENCVTIVSADNVSIKGCWLYTAGEGKSVILLSPVETSNSKITIEDNCIVGDNNNFGIYSFEVREGVVISNNLIRNCANPMYFNYFNGASVVNNKGVDNNGPFIYLQSGGVNTIFDGNVSEDEFPILSLHPDTSPLVSIGDNSSPISRTSYKGYVIMPASQTNVLTNNGMFAAEYYYRVITMVSPEGNIGSVWVENSASWSEARINCTIAPGVDTKIYYIATAIPYSATQ